MKVYLVEDSPFIRERLSELLREIPKVVICGEAETPADALLGIEATQPEVVVIDMQLAGGSGLSVLRELQRIAPAAAPIVLTNYAFPQFRLQCLFAGAMYFFDKTAEFGKVREAIETISARLATGD
ncbi:MAG TPA: response regulator [Burkholderiales bacterium]|nr:response regulator [Burkholderiales bacterium]